MNSSTTTKTYAVIGASRGIGHEFVSQLLSKGHRLIATTRSGQRGDATKLWPGSGEGRTYTSLLHHLQTNTIGPTILSARLLSSPIPLRKLIFISSDSSSATRFLSHEDGFAAYAASKAALNMLLRHMSAELRRKGSDTVVLALHPGEVYTDMARAVEGKVGWEVEGMLSVGESVRGCVEVIEGKGKGDEGTFWTGEGERYITTLKTHHDHHHHHHPLSPTIPLKTSLIASALANLNFNSSLSSLTTFNASSNSVTRSTFLCRYLLAASVFFCRFCTFVGSPSHSPSEDGELRFIPTSKVEPGVAVGRVEDEEEC
ncbi:hypothetical protein TI39_contig669g00014 [Zymoseptoria brevis]|uniref:Short-chain dehydrogenase like protein n=1 Tax=Zymoseptoria brevis TaxID=1047168 RepID=A0A0F4GGE7_9PEZI|nr:hypothetical protein TI39_contig669g00014 [Zymoseptoria brevis]